MDKAPYPKWLRELAKEQKRHLCTIDVPGLFYQGTISQERRRQLIELVTKLFGEGPACDEQRETKEAQS